MSVTSTRQVFVKNWGDVSGSTVASAAENTSAPGQEQVITLEAEDNTITVPGGGTTPTALTIIKPANNTVQMVLKGDTGDVGFRLHNTDPDSFSFDPSVTEFIITCLDTVTGVRLVWS